MTQDEERAAERPSPTGNHTSFRPEEAPDSRESYFKRQRMTNTGEFTGWWRNQDKSREVDNFNQFRSISCQLDLSDSQKTRGQHLFVEHVDDMVDTFSVKTLAFTVCLYVCNEQVTRWDPRNGEDWASFLCQRHAALDLDYNRVVACYSALVKREGEP